METSGHSLNDVEVAITGKLAAMSRDEAVERIQAAGGRVVAAPRATTALLVVGQGGPPLGEDGRLTHALQRAYELQDAGAGPAIVGEEQLLTRLGQEQYSSGLSRRYTTGQLARILAVAPSLIRLWVRQGLIRPAHEHARLFFFEFPQVASAKALCDLFQAGVDAARIRRSLGQLAERERSGGGPGAGSAARMLGQLAVLEHAGPLFVRTPDGGLAEPNGQMHFAFADSDPPRLRLLARAEERRIEEWFDIGIRAEREGRFEDAVRAYRSALARDERHPEVHFNLGNALYAVGELAEARAEFHRAVELAPDYVEAWNNLGILLGEMERPDAAIRAYRRALGLAPDYPDALYNLAETLVLRGELAEARELWLAYLRADPESPFARIVRERLAQL
jgi:tetratricopeptide (TPR) repeat protein